jgi:hypothetical protein
MANNPIKLKRLSWSVEIPRGGTRPQSKIAPDQGKETWHMMHGGGMMDEKSEKEDGCPGKGQEKFFPVWLLRVVTSHETSFVRLKWHCLAAIETISRLSPFSVGNHGQDNETCQSWKEYVIEIGSDGGETDSRQQNDQDRGKTADGDNCRPNKCSDEAISISGSRVHFPPLISRISPFALADKPRRRRSRRRSNLPGSA